MCGCFCVSPTPPPPQHQGLCLPQAQPCMTAVCQCVQEQTYPENMTLSPWRWWQAAAYITCLLATSSPVIFRSWRWMWQHMYFGHLHLNLVCRLLILVRLTRHICVNRYHVFDAVTRHFRSILWFDCLVFFLFRRITGHILYRFLEHIYNGVKLQKHFSDWKHYI